MAGNAISGTRKIGAALYEFLRGGSGLRHRAGRNQHGSKRYGNDLGSAARKLCDSFGCFHVEHSALKPAPAARAF
jgi:hypothetical protein